MATVMYIPEKKQSLGAMKGVMSYVCQEKKTRDPVTGQRFVTGVHCLGDNACREFLATKRTYGRDEGHELLPVRAILLSKRGGHIGEGPRHRFGVCPKSLAGLRGVGGHSPGRRAPAFPLCGELRQLGDGSEAAAIPQDLADPPGPER